MPNWCMNNLTVSHGDPAKLQEFVDAYNSGKTCEHYLPVPSGYYDDESWYDWCIQNWGTKWDFGKREHDDPVTVEGNKVVVSFDTAWSPPVEFYGQLVDLEYNVRASYFEPGLAFCGIWDNCIDNYIEYGGVEKIEEVIPVALWNEYAMDEFFEMMGEE